MASEIRVNQIQNRSGLSTITFSDSGVIISGITTISDLRTSGTTVVAAGSASAPSISPTGDSNTGIFFPSADTVAFAEGGVEALRITSSGTVGVNTTAVDSQLEVHSAASKINTVTIKTSAGASGYAGLAFMAGQTSAGREKAAIYFQETNGGAHYTGDIVFALNSTSGSAVQVSTSDERLRITSSGNLGIGTNNPTKALHISQNSDVAIRMHSGNCNTNARSWEIVVGGNASNNAEMVFRTRNDAGTGGSEAARFTTSGNLAFPSGQGIDFSATANSSGTMTSELLSDYEEGTFTPQFLGGISNPVYTASTAYGHYTKIGNTVHCWGLIVVSAVTSNGSGNWWLDGFPFAPATGMTYAQVGLIGYNDVQTNEVNKFYMISGATYAVIMPNGVTQSNETYNSNAITTGYFGFTVTYKT